jgi:glutamate---cysteine ligase / carboxylate-amine ligase
VSPIPLFGACGVEIEHMIVDRETLDVRPLADRALAEVGGLGASDAEDGAIGWSNELVLHLIELKTNGPAPSFAGLAAEFQRSVGRLNALLAPLGARLMPTGMHPWMRPERETVLWPHEGREIYAAFDGLFDCRRHGWANVQSVHLNLPFAGEEEFGRLLAAVRLVLPLLPALAASSPVTEGRPTGRLDTRLEHYRHHCDLIPAMTGAVIPERAYTFADYRHTVFDAIDVQLAPLDPERRLVGHEWLNARGAIARFDRDAIEIRLIDTQECPRADLALCAAVTCVLRALVEERWSSGEEQRAFGSEALARALEAAGRIGPDAPLEDAGYLRLLGREGARTAGELWRGLVHETFDGPAELGEPLRVVLEQGTLAQRILAALGPEPARARIAAVYRELCDCLAEGRLFGAHPEARPLL